LKFICNSSQSGKKLHWKTTYTDHRSPGS